MPRRSKFAKKDNEESSYYTIDNTEDIYGMKLSPAQRCYIDPWDLENYDYVRRKVDYSSSPASFYETSSKHNTYGPVDSNFDLDIQAMYNDNYGYLRCSPEICDENVYGINDLFVTHDDPMHGYEEFSTSSDQSSLGNSSRLDFTYSISPYECCNCYSLYESCGNEKPRSSLSNIYGGSLYTNKFGLSKKGLLQIDYSYSWDDLDKTIGSNYYFKAK